MYEEFNDKISFWDVIKMNDWNKIMEIEINLFFIYEKGINQPSITINREKNIVDIKKHVISRIQLNDNINSFTFKYNSINEERSTLVMEIGFVFREKGESLFYKTLDELISQMSWGNENKGVIYLSEVFIKNGVLVHV